MNRLLPALLLVLLSADALPALAAEPGRDCAPGVFTTLGRELKVKRFSPEGDGVVVASVCKRLPADPHLTLAAVAWNAGQEDSRALAVALLDEPAGTVVALGRQEIDEDATTHVDDGALRLDTAAYDLAPGVRAFGVDLVSENRSCGEGGLGPSRTLYVREGRTIRPVMTGLSTTSYWYLRGNEPRCTDAAGARDALLEDYKVTIALGAPGKGGWRDLELTATSTRSDHRPGRKPLHVRVPYDGRAYSLEAFNKAFEHWKE